eukprot:PhF_6_TR42680/c0_g1_i3/m.64356
MRFPHVQCILVIIVINCIPSQGHGKLRFRDGPNSEITAPNVPVEMSHQIPSASPIIVELMNDATNTVCAGDVDTVIEISSNCKDLAFVPTTTKTVAGVATFDDFTMNSCPRDSSTETCVLLFKAITAAKTPECDGAAELSTGTLKVTSLPATDIRFRLNKPVPPTTIYVNIPLDTITIEVVDSCEVVDVGVTGVTMRLLFDNGTLVFNTTVNRGVAYFPSLVFRTTGNYNLKFEAGKEFSLEVQGKTLLWQNVNVIGKPAWSARIVIADAAPRPVIVKQFLPKIEIQILDSAGVIDITTQTIIVTASVVVVMNGKDVAVTGVEKLLSQVNVTVVNGVAAYDKLMFQSCVLYPENKTVVVDPDDVVVLFTIGNQGNTNAAGTVLRHPRVTVVGQPAFLFVFNTTGTSSAQYTCDEQTNKVGNGGITLEVRTSCGTVDTDSFGGTATAMTTYWCARVVPAPELQTLNPHNVIPKVSGVLRVLPTRAGHITWNIGILRGNALKLAFRVCDDALFEAHNKLEAIAVVNRSWGPTKSKTRHTPTKERSQTMSLTLTETVTDTQSDTNSRGTRSSSYSDSKSKSGNSNTPEFNTRTTTPSDTGKTPSSTIVRTATIVSTQTTTISKSASTSRTDILWNKTRTAIVEIFLEDNTTTMEALVLEVVKTCSQFDDATHTFVPYNNETGPNGTLYFNTSSVFVMWNRTYKPLGGMKVYLHFPYGDFDAQRFLDILSSFQLDRKFNLTYRYAKLVMNNNYTTNNVPKFERELLHPDRQADAVFWSVIVYASIVGVIVTVWGYRLYWAKYAPKEMKHPQH